MRALQDALEEVFAGDQSLEAAALQEQLADRGYVVVPYGFAQQPDLRLPRRRWWPVIAVALFVAVVAGMVASAESTSEPTPMTPATAGPAVEFQP